MCTIRVRFEGIMKMWTTKLDEIKNLFNQIRLGDVVVGCFPGETQKMELPSLCHAMQKLVLWGLGIKVRHVPFLGCPSIYYY